MSDVRLIDANKLKRDFAELCATECAICSFYISSERASDCHCGLIDRAPTVEQPTGKWIPVSERLPDKMGTYLVTLEYKEYGQGITTLWYHGEGIGWDLRVADVVIAWMPLPEPYKKGDEE